MNTFKTLGSTAWSFGRYELRKLLVVLQFVVSSGFLTAITGYLGSIDLGKYGTIIMAAWNLLLAFIYYFAKDNTKTPYVAPEGP